ncbi:hypothetical protein QYF61_022867 [Mycteria americana]|uniref:Uncharacterized protein n=1 Tax=Mycteria americana TaxID=33587 RepID=A0AAN7MWX1_MYCAM|nr:hypothetical protein QYF61_022867 [Mycteria americana]
MRSPLSLLFSRLNNPSSLSHSPSALCSRPFPSSVALLWTRSIPSIEGPNTEHSIRGAASPVPSTGDDHCPSPAGHTIPDTSQDAIGFLGRLGTLLAHIQSAVNQVQWQRTRILSQPQESEISKNTQRILKTCEFTTSKGMTELLQPLPDFKATTSSEFALL